MEKKPEIFNQRYLLHTRRYATLAGVVILVVIALVALVVVPQGQAVVEAFTQLQKTEKDVQSLQQKVAQLQGLPQSVILQAGDSINSALPSKKPLLELLSAYSVIAQEAGVRFSDVSISPGLIATESATPTTTAGGANQAAPQARRVAPTRRASTDYDQLDLSLKVSGDLDSISLFLQRIEEIAPITTVTSVSLTERVIRTAEQAAASTFEAELVTTSYFFTQPVSNTARDSVPSLSPAQQDVIQEIQGYFVPQIDEQTIIRGGGLQDLFGLTTEELLQ